MLIISCLLDDLREEYVVLVTSAVFVVIGYRAALEMAEETEELGKVVVAMW